MMRRDTEVGHDAVESAYTIIAHPVAYVPEVASYEYKAWVVCQPTGVAGEQVVHRVGVLVESEEPPSLTEPAHNLLAMAAASEGDVGVYAVGSDIEPVDALRP